jgi:hypothetical protein
VRARAGARGLRAVMMASWSSGDVYLNFIDDEGGDQVLAGHLLTAR